MHRYAALLEDEMGQHAYVETIYTSELQEFCVEAGFEVRVVDNSAVILGFFRPPQQTVDVTDWERAVRLRCIPQALSIIFSVTPHLPFTHPYKVSACKTHSKACCKQTFSLEIQKHTMYIHTYTRISYHFHWVQHKIPP
eukprot:1179735-Prorocentrum_minimum.AAC.4